MADIRPLSSEAKQFLSGYRAALNDVRTLADLREIMSLQLAMLLDHMHVDTDDMERSAREGHLKRRRARLRDLFGGELTDG